MRVRSFAMGIAAAALPAAGWLLLDAEVEVAPGPAFAASRTEDGAEMAAAAALEAAPAVSVVVPPGASPPAAPALATSGAPRRAAASRRGPPLSRARGWLESLAAFAAVVSKDPAETLARVDGAWRAATDPVVRQNCAFHVALALPRPLSAAWLRARRTSTEGADDDREDALVALAFAGDADARSAFVALARTPSPAHVRRLVDDVDAHEALGKEGGAAAAVLRAYRAVEALDGDPYFDITPYRVAMAPWQGAPALDDASRRELLEAWLARYPGHPGSDDLALRVARLWAKAGEDFAAARWYSRASVLPDKDVTGAAMRGLVATCELVLPIHEVRRLAWLEGDRTPNRELLEYVHARRTAAEVGVAWGLGCVRDAASADPRSALAIAWSRRRDRTPMALDSGVAPLSASDELRRRTPFHDAEDAAAYRDRMLRWAGASRRFGGTWGWGYADPHTRLSPPSEALQVSPFSLASQVGAWEVLVELDERAATAGPASRADLLYKQAAVLYRDPDVLYPVYACHSSEFAYVLQARAGDEATREADARRRFAAFQTRSLSLVRAIPLFERVERDYPAYAAADEAVFSQGIAWIRLASYRPYLAGDDWDDRRLRCLREGTLAFERCAARFPASPLADDAARAATYWRRVRPDAFR